MLMTIQDRKLEIIELVTKTKDIGVLDAVKVVLVDDFSHDHWETLSEAQKSRIKQAMDSADAGKLRPHKEVMTELRQKLLNGTL